MINASPSDVSIGFFITHVLAGIWAVAFNHQLKSAVKSLFNEFAIANFLFRN